jgi:hypothetical protein
MRRAGRAIEVQGLEITLNVLRHEVPIGHARSAV